ncbi:hypothetical protein OS493_012326 [Desmophyllum pertusum]|uniref:Uncharacterized protein n=1 Tax=Desmophyllum pertusum TaxID=174260 RepID=A0A9X0D527_9CNID|nr:hypothetical protein OS493_012326 [Desmophyllum pertusum]
MWMSLSNQKIAWTASRTKAITVSIADSNPTKAQEKYFRRPKEEDVSFLQWMRLYDHTKNPPKKYKEGTSTLVGTKERTVFSDKGLISEDRSNKATLQLTIPRSLFKSSAKDLSPETLEFAIDSAVGVVVPLGTLGRMKTEVFYSCSPC